MDTNAEDRSRAYATGPDFMLSKPRYGHFLILSLDMLFHKMDTNAEDRSRAYATGPDFILNYLFLSCRGTGPIFV